MTTNRGRVAFTIPSTEYGARGYKATPPRGGEFSPCGMTVETLLTGKAPKRKPFCRIGRKMLDYLKGLGRKHR